MIRALDPLFSRFTRHRHADHAKIATPATPRSAGATVKPARPRWDAPAHWLEPETNW